MSGATRRIAIGVFGDPAQVNEALNQLRQVGVHSPKIFTKTATGLPGRALPSSDLRALTDMLPETLARALEEQVSGGCVAVCAEIGEATTERAVAEVLLASHAETVQLHDCQQHR